MASSEYCTKGGVKGTGLFVFVEEEEEVFVSSVIEWSGQLGIFYSEYGLNKNTRFLAWLLSLYARAFF